MNETLKRCPVCGGDGTYERHEDGWATCSRCGMEANSVAADCFDDRTCYNENEGHDSNEFVCSACHIRLADFAEIVEEDGQAYKFYYALRYCPCCGAKVVDNER